MRKQSKARFVNGVIAALAMCLFAAHAILGVVSAFVPVTRTFAPAVWVGMLLVALHVVVSVVTSRQQLLDREHPPSARKKRHLALKWATGIVLIAVVAAHVACVETLGADAAQVTFTGLAAVIALCAVTAAHLWVGSKSLLKDLGFDTRHRNALGIAIAVFTVLLVVAAVVGSR